MADISTEELERIEREYHSGSDNIKPIQEFSKPEDLYDELIASIRKYHPSTDITLIEKAYHVAFEAHKGQVRKSGEAYIIHPLCVAIILVELELDKETIAAGLLHDVLEDTTVTEDMLKCFCFDDKVIRAVRLLTHVSGDTYDAYVEKLKVSRLAMKIKCADMSDNENLNRLKCPGTRDVQRSAFYHSRRLRIESCLREKKVHKEKV